MKNENTTHVYTQISTIILLSMGAVCSRTRSTNVLRAVYIMAWLITLALWYVCVCVCLCAQLVKHKEQQMFFVEVRR